MFVTADQLVLHALGDYVLQSDWMSQQKTKSYVPALVHATVYTIPFFMLTSSWKALLFILVTHFFIDRYRLARYVCWAKNFLAPKVTMEAYVEAEAAGEREMHWWHPWAECFQTGYHIDRPLWMTVWLMIIADNVLHVLLNAVALRWLA